MVFFIVAEKYLRNICEAGLDRKIAFRGRPQVMMACCTVTVIAEHQEGYKGSQGAIMGTAIVFVFYKMPYL